MRALGLIGLVLALVIVGLLAKRQLDGTAVAPANPAGAAATAPGGIDLQGSPKQIEQQFKQSIDAATQPRPMPDDN